MDRQFFSGNSLQQAVMSAARYFSIEPERVAYSVREKKHGFVGGPGGRRRVIIEVDPDAPERDPSSLNDQVSQDEGSEPVGRRVDQEKESFEVRDLSVDRAQTWRADLGEEWSPDESDVDVEIAAARQAAKEVFRFLGISADVTIEKVDGVLSVDIENSDTDVWIRNEGQLMQSLEHLLPRMLRGYLGRGAPCRVDFDGFRSERERAIEEVARTAAIEVKRHGEAEYLDPMSPGDRRVAHLALADEDGVSTRSEGNGFLKRVVVRPA